MAERIVACPGCNTQVAIDASQGTRFACPSCGQVMTVAAPAARKPATPPQAARTKAPASGPGSMVGVIAAACAVLGLGAFFAWKGFGNAPPPPAAGIAPGPAAGKAPTPAAGKAPAGKAEPAADLTLAEPSLLVRTNDAQVWFVVPDGGDDLPKRVFLRYGVPKHADRLVPIKAWDFPSQRRYSAEIAYSAKDGADVCLVDRVQQDRKRSAVFRLDANSKVEVPFAEAATLEVGANVRRYNLGLNMNFDATWRFRQGHPLPDHEYTFLVNGEKAQGDILRIDNELRSSADKGGQARLGIEEKGKNRPGRTYTFTVGGRKKGETAWRNASNPVVKTINGP